MNLEEDPILDANQIREQLGRILRSPQFARSDRLRRFLQFIVDAKLRGEPDQIQEYGIGLEIFGRLPSFDPRSDSIVRTEAHRLRRKLTEYYQDAGENDPVRISLPERGYVPEFSACRGLERTRADAQGRRTRRWALALAVAAALLLIGAVWSTRPLPETARSSNRLANEAFAKGRAAWGQWTREGAEQSVAFFQQAIAHDPDFALAHVWLSNSYRQRLGMGDSRFDQVFPLAKAASERALAIDPELAEAHWSQGATLTWQYEWEAAEREFLEAQALAPQNPAIHHAYAILCLAAGGRLDEAETEIRAAVDLQPALLSNKVVLGKILYFRGRYHEARDELEEALAINRNFPDAMRNLAAVLVQTGDFPAAIAYYRKAQSLSYLTWGDGLLAHAYAAAGDTEQARAIVTKLLGEQETRKVSYLALATAYTGLGDTEVALNWLARSVEEHEMRARYVAVDPIYTPLHGDPHFGELLATMRLPSAREGSTSLSSSLSAKPLH